WAKCRVFLFGCETSGTFIYPLALWRHESFRDCHGFAANELSCGPTRYAATSTFSLRGWARDPWAVVLAKQSEDGRETACADFSAWRSHAADAARLALHVLLREQLRHEPISSKSRLHRACHQLSQRHWLRTGVSGGSRPRGTRRFRISRRCGRGKIPAKPQRCRCQAHRSLGRELRWLFDRTGAGPQLRFVCRRRGFSWSA